jgi:tripartite-type tricarboxylate transporter receptor subunit TctC
MRKHPSLHMSALVLALACGLAAPAAGQEWPKRQPIKVVVPATAGSTSDIMARTVYEQVGRQIGQTVITENRGGGGTTIGMAMVAKSAPDGYTLLVNSTSYVVVASTYAKLPYDPYNDMIGIALLAHLPFMITTSTKYKTLEQFLQAGRIKPTPLNFGTVGHGSSGHLFVERFMHAARFDAKHVPFRGVPEAMTELVADRLDLFTPPIPSMKGLAMEGKISVLGIASSKRSSLFPDVKTTLEAGYPNSDYNFWMGSYMPAKTPRAIVERLNAEANKALRNPEIRKKIEVQGGETEPMSVDQFNAFIAKEREVNAAIVKMIGFKPR